MRKTADAALILLLVGTLVGSVWLFSRGTQYRPLENPVIDVATTPKPTPPPVAVAKAPQIVSEKIPNQPVPNAPVPAAVLPSEQSHAAIVSPRGPAPAMRAANSSSGNANASSSNVMAEPIAREALNYVGMDTEAEAVWTSAINDPSLSPHDRKNLIEDLNENGFADPNHPTPNDLPLIESRLALIEDMAPDSMDAVNAAAFAEAYKDLTEMHDRLTK